ncbi:hypothetical protein [Treponema pedis]|uniref:hypothetical protein n=1 Tax=Treponema pedis TaxID=409322 RepID=UPI001981644F|nr:hypothetical protein [Treponema pedis]QSI05725.1 hypothetical protein DYQ05_12835 [Treponema pedis]
MSKQRKSVLLAGITALLGLMLLTACPVKPARSEKQTDKKEEVQENILDTVWDITAFYGKYRPDTSPHRYIYVSNDGSVYEAEKDKNTGFLKEPEQKWLEGANFKSNIFTFEGVDYTYTLKNGTLTVGEPGKKGGFGLEAVKVDSPTGQEIMAVQKNKAEAEQIQ